MGKADTETARGEETDTISGGAPTTAHELCMHNPVTKLTLLNSVVISWLWNFYKDANMDELTSH